MIKNILAILVISATTLFSVPCIGQENFGSNGIEAQVDLSETRKVEIKASQSAICNGRAVQLLTNLQSTDKFSWSPREVLLNPESKNPWVLSDKDVNITLKTTINGQEQEKNILIRVENVRASFEANPTKGAAPLAVQFNNKSENAQLYFWDFGFNESKEEHPEVIYREPGVFSSSLVVEGVLGCKDTMYQKNIKVYEEAKFFIPTTFTPNYDGINETFELVSRNVKHFKCDIFNSYGEKIYTIREARDSWDGTFNGYPAPASSYVYRIEYSDLSGGVHKLVGSVELKR